MSSKLLSILLSSAVAAAARADGDSVHDGSQEKASYSPATNGVVDFGNWKVLLDESNLGGKELELSEVTFPAGYAGNSHTHDSVEIFYVLSGTFGHEVNGKLHLLKPGMVGVVRPGDTVRHVVPKESDAKLLVIWAPAGEAKRIGFTTTLRCAYPQLAIYKGSGSRKETENFQCKAPPSTAAP